MHSRAAVVGTAMLISIIKSFNDGYAGINLVVGKRRKLLMLKKIIYFSMLM